MRVPKAAAAFKYLGFDPSIVSFQWFMCLFSYNMPDIVTYAIYDVFFLEGINFLEKVSIALIYYV